MHHNKKVDAPSGTALMLGEAAAGPRDRPRQAFGARPRRPHRCAPGRHIGFAALRGGNVIGEHTVILAGADRADRTHHIAEDRAMFADGALPAALWARGKKPGLYTWPTCSA